MNVKPLDGGVGEPNVCAEGVAIGRGGSEGEAGVMGRAGFPSVCVVRVVPPVPPVRYDCVLYDASEVCSDECPPNSSGKPSCAGAGFPPSGERPKVDHRVSAVLGRLRGGVRGGERVGGEGETLGVERDARLARRAMMRLPGEAGNPASASSTDDAVRVICVRDDIGECVLLSRTGGCEEDATGAEAGSGAGSGADPTVCLRAWDPPDGCASLWRSSSSALRSGWILRGRGDGSDDAVGSGGLGGAGATGGGAGFDTVNARRRSRVNRLGMRLE